MITTNPRPYWGSNVLPPLTQSTAPRIRSRSKGYGVESESRVLLIGVCKARKARWISKAFRPRCPAPLPAENMAAIALLDSWLSTPDVEYDEGQERLERLIEENRL